LLTLPPSPLPVIVPPPPALPLLLQLTSVVATKKEVKVVGVTEDEHATLGFASVAIATQWAAEINAAISEHASDAKSAAELAVDAGNADPSAGVADEDGAAAAAAATAAGEPDAAAAATEAAETADAADVGAGAADDAAAATEETATVDTTSPADASTAATATTAAAVTTATATATTAAATATALSTVATTEPLKDEGRFVPTVAEEAQSGAAGGPGGSGGGVSTQAVPTLPGSDPTIEPGKVEYDEVTKRHKAFYYSQGAKVELGSFFTEAAATAVHDAVTYLKVNPYAEDFSVESLIDLTAPIDPAHGSVTFDESLKKWVTKAVVGGKEQELGTFFTQEAAVVAFNERDTLCAQQ
jgi:hypothetical protein